jgi:hypothetical protein
VNLAACARLRLTPENGVWYRLVPSNIPLSAALGSARSKKTDGRFNAGPYNPPPDQFSTLSFADDPLVAQFEVGAVLGSPAPGRHVPHPRLSHTSLNVQVVLHQVVDLTDVTWAQGVLWTNAQELTGDWRSYRLRNRLHQFSSPQVSLRHRNSVGPSFSYPAWKDSGPFQRKWRTIRR